VILYPIPTAWPLSAKSLALLTVAAVATNNNLSEDL